MEQYPDWVLLMQSFEGFEKRFWHNLAEHKFEYHADAYRLTEMEFEHYFDRRRYASYNAFKTAQSRKHKK